MGRATIDRPAPSALPFIDVDGSVARGECHWGGAVLPKYVPIAAYNAEKRKRDRERYIAEYAQRPETERAAEDAFYHGKTISDVITEFDTRLGDRVEEYERRAEQFLTLSSSGGLAIIATMFANSTEKINVLVIASAILLVASFLLVAALKIMQVQTAYFRQGEWQKNLKDFVHGKIGLGELAWRTTRSHRAPRVFINTALTSLALMVAGVVFLIASIWPTKLPLSPPLSQAPIVQPKSSP